MPVAVDAVVVVDSVNNSLVVATVAVVDVVTVTVLTARTTAVTVLVLVLYLRFEHGAWHREGSELEVLHCRRHSHNQVAQAVEQAPNSAQCCMSKCQFVQLSSILVSMRTCLPSTGWCEGKRRGRWQIAPGQCPRG